MLVVGYKKHITIALLLPIFFFHCALILISWGLIVNSTINTTLLEATGPEMNQSRLTLKEFLNSIFFGQFPQSLLQDPFGR